MDKRLKQLIDNNVIVRCCHQMFDDSTFVLEALIAVSQSNERLIAQLAELKLMVPRRIKVGDKCVVYRVPTELIPIEDADNHILGSQDTLGLEITNLYAVEPTESAVRSPQGDTETHD